MKKRKNRGVVGGKWEINIGVVGGMRERNIGIERSSSSSGRKEKK